MTKGNGPRGFFIPATGCGPHEDYDELSAVRGIINGIMLGTVMWYAALLTVWRFW